MIKSGNDKIEYLQLSIKTYRALKKANIKTISEIKTMSRKQLKSIANIDEKAYEEVSEKLSELGINSNPENDKSGDNLLLIESYELSKRTYNCLKNSGIDSLYDLIKMTEEEIKSIRNLGKKSFKEIEVFLKEVSEENLFSGKYKDVNINLKDLDNSILTNHLEIKGEIESILFRHENLLKEDLELKYLHFPKEITKNLINSGITTVVDLSNTNLDKLREIISADDIYIISENIYKITYIKFKNKSYDELIGYKELYNILLTDLDKYNVDYNALELKINLDNLLCEKLNKCIYIDLSNDLEIKENQLLEILISNNYLRELLIERLTNFFSKTNKYKTLYEIENTLPLKLRNKNNLKCIIDRLVYNGTLEEKERSYRLYLPTLLEYFHGSEERNTQILFNRLSGKTLKKVGQEFNLTRERVRQIERQSFSKIPKVREDDYRLIFEKYKWNRSLFMTTFEESILTYEYLLSKYSIGNIDQKEILFDESIEKQMRQRAGKVLNKYFIILENNKIAKSRSSILEHVIMTYCKEDTTVKELEKHHKDFLLTHGLEKNENLYFPKRYFESTLPMKKNILWKLGKKLRYYNCEDVDSEQLVNDLNLDKITDSEFSALKFFRDYINIMEELDIRDEYELHNLIKKVVDLNKYEIKVSRMPTLEFGESDREKQVVDLLFENAPIEVRELAVKYELEYGVRADTVIANYFNSINEYLHDGYFRINYKDLPENQFLVMKSKLSEDSYHIKEIRTIFKEEFPEYAEDIMNSYNLKKLNFRISNNVIYSDKYNSLDQYFRKIITENDIFEEDKLKKWVITNSSYYSALHSLRYNSEIFEFTPRKYLNIRRLESNGITKQDLQEYSNSVHDFIGSEFFTIKFLKKRGYVHSLDDLGFGDLFYVSLLISSKKFKARKVGNNILLQASKEPITIADLVEYLILEHRSIDVYDFLELLDNNYGINIEKHRLIYSVIEKELYYDEIMGKIYIDYDEYFEEV